MISVRCNYLDIVSLLLKRDDLDLNVRSANGATSLIIAANKGFLEITASLTLNAQHRNIDLNAKDLNSWTALGIATNRCDVRMMSLLLDCEGIDVNEKCEVVFLLTKEFFYHSYGTNSHSSYAQ